MPPYDAVLVPGGGVRDRGELPPWVEARLDKAFEYAQGSHIIALTAGTTHKAPPLDDAGHPILESVAGARYLARRGYPPHLLLVETASYDTIGNAYFSRAIHTDPAGFRNLLVITSEFHMPRTEAVFRWIFHLPPVVRPYALTFLSVPDTGMPDDVRARRRAKEQAGLEMLPHLIARHDSLASLHRWLFSKHSAYSPAASNRPASTSDPLLRSSY